MTKTICSQIAALLVARENCDKAVPYRNAEWFDKHSERLESLVKNRMPGGSGFDSGTQLDYDKSNGDRLVFITAFHHMNDGGFYDGWTHHTVVVTPAFDGFDLKVTGRDKRDIKDYIAECFHHALSENAE